MEVFNAVLVVRYELGTSRTIRFLRVINNELESVTKLEYIEQLTHKIGCEVLLKQIK